MMIEKHYNFTLTSLTDYTFTISKERSYGCDSLGQFWQEPELTIQRKKGLIIKEYPHKVVFIENILIGYIQECLDGTWLALSPYNPVILDVEVSGFINEFYAVRYLHQVIKANYPDEIGDFPYLPWEKCAKEL